MKRDENGYVQRYKAQNVIHKQKESTTVKMKYFRPWYGIQRFDHYSLCQMLRIGKSTKWTLRQLSSKETLIEKEIYMRQPDGYVSEEYPNHVCNLKKTHVHDIMLFPNDSSMLNGAAKDSPVYQDHLQRLNTLRQVTQHKKSYGYEDYSTMSENKINHLL